MGTGIGCSHCYFPEAEMDEVVLRGPWRFGRNGDAYIAVYCNPYALSVYGSGLVRLRAPCRGAMNFF